MTWAAAQLSAAAFAAASALEFQLSSKPQTLTLTRHFDFAAHTDVTLEALDGGDQSILRKLEFAPFPQFTCAFSAACIAERERGIRPISEIFYLAQTCSPYM